MYKRVISILVVFIMFITVLPGIVAAADQQAVVSVASAEMRQSNSSTAKVLYTLKKNTQVTVTGTSGSWYKVKYSGKAGYILKTSLTIVKAASTTEINVNKTLRKGDTGNEVKALQYTLKALSFYFGEITGIFDNATYEAVRFFQATAEITVDGVAGPQTLQLLKDGFILSENVTDGDTPQVEINPEDIPPSIESPYQYKAEKADWFKEVNKAFPPNAVATVVDVRTGFVWKVMRVSGSASSHHADCEPLTLTDTNNLKKIIGGYSWNRRPILVTYKGRTFAASMNFMPHGNAPGKIVDNGFPGHFCIHFLNSKTHGTNKVDSDHQRCVSEAFESKYALGKDGDPGISDNVQEMIEVNVTVK